MRTAKILCLSSLLVLLAACGKQVAERAMERAIEKETGGSARVNIQGNGAMKVETKEGTYVAGGNQLPADWPVDAPVYAGATVQFSGSANPTTGKSGAAAVLMTADSAADVLAYYKTELKTKGWTISSTMEAQGTSIIGATKGTRAFSLMVGSTEGKTTITIGVGQQ